MERWEQKIGSEGFSSNGEGEQKIRSERVSTIERRNRDVLPR